MKTVRIIAILAALAFTACQGYRVAGKITTSYGSVSSDGKTVTVEADTRGFAK